MAQRYPIPSKPEALKPAFERLCKELTSEQVAGVRQRVVERLREMSSSELDESYLGPNTELGVQVAQVCIQLLDGYEQLEPAERKQVSGAVLYFLAEKDLTPDSTPIVGYDDDVRLLNHVLEAIDREDLIVANA